MLGLADLLQVEVIAAVRLLSVLHLPLEGVRPVVGVVEEAEGLPHGELLDS